MNKPFPLLSGRLFAKPRFPIAILRVARTESEHCVRQALSETSLRAYTHEQCAVAAAFDTPQVMIEQVSRISHSQWTGRQAGTDKRAAGPQRDQCPLLSRILSVNSRPNSDTGWDRLGSAKEPGENLI